jgi:hypothetical protein
VDYAAIVGDAPDLGNLGRGDVAACMCLEAAPLAALPLIAGMAVGEGLGWLRWRGDRQERRKEAGNCLRPNGHRAARWVCVSEVVTGGNGGRDGESISAHAPRRRGVHRHASIGRDCGASGGAPYGSPRSRSIARMSRSVRWSA